MPNPLDTASPIDALRALLEANPQLDLRTLNGSDEDALARLSWPDIDLDRAALLEQLRGYQRLLQLFPNDDRPVLLGLLQRGIRSAVHLAAIPRARFLSEFSQSFGGDRPRMRAVHDAALARRSELALRYLATRQTLELSARPISARGSKD
jgi:hypothetical protein